MTNGLYTGAVGLIPQMKKQEIIANNLANVNTTGYKKDGMYFQNILEGKLYTQMESGNVTDIGDVSINFQQGALVETGNQFDIAVVGDGFFAVQTPQGIAYTRNGNFAVDDNGQLVNNLGYPILGESGIIQINPLHKIIVTEQGEIIANGVQVERLLIKDFEQRELLQKIGNSLFVPVNQNIEERLLEQINIKQGYLEQSNVNPIEEMVEMLLTLRRFEAIQQSIDQQNETLGKTTNELGRVN